MHKTMSRQIHASIIGEVRQPFRKELLWNFPAFPNGSSCSVQHNQQRPEQQVRRQAVTENRLETKHARFLVCGLMAGSVKQKAK
jgi:hypothetical protein